MFAQLLVLGACVVVSVAQKGDRNINSISYGATARTALATMMHTACVADNVEPNSFTNSSPLFSAASKHYVPSYRPNEQSGSPDKVVLRVQPRRLIQLNDVEQSFVLDLKLVSSWRDPRLNYTVHNSQVQLDESTFRLPMRAGRDGEPDGSYSLSTTPGNADPLRLWSPRIESLLNFHTLPATLNERVSDL